MEESKTVTSFGLMSPTISYSRREDSKKFDKMKTKQVCLSITELNKQTNLIIKKIHVFLE